MVKKLSLKTFDYDQVRLVPGSCQVNSRSEVDTFIQFGHYEFKLPVVPSNMSTIVDEALASWLAKNGYFYVMHRFNVDPVAFSKSMTHKGLYTSLSIGVQPQDFRTVELLARLNNQVAYVTVDVAHGDTDSVLRMVERLKKLSFETFVIAGNVARPEAVERLEAAGADAIKVGIAPGSVCRTYQQTGFGTRDWQLSALEWCAEAAKTALIVADGGIRENGDIAKAVAFGADMVMAGGFFAGHDENPGELIEDENGLKSKVFYGSASEHQKGEIKHIEGTKINVPYKGTIVHTYNDIKESLQSAISYAGGRKLLDLRNSDYVLLS